MKESRDLQVLKVSSDRPLVLFHLPNSFTNRFSKAAQEEDFFSSFGGQRLLVFLPVNVAASVGGIKGIEGIGPRTQSYKD